MFVTLLFIHFLFENFSYVYFTFFDGEYSDIFNIFDLFMSYSSKISPFLYPSFKTSFIFE